MGWGGRVVEGAKGGSRVRLFRQDAIGLGGAFKGAIRGRAGAMRAFAHRIRTPSARVPRLL